MDVSEHERAWAEVSITSSVLRKAWEMELADFGLTVPQVLVLELLAASPEPLTPGRLALFMYRKPHTISALLGRMEKQGLIRRRRDPKRENTVLVSMSKKGKESFELQRDANRVRNITACLSKQDLSALHEINQKLRARGLDLIKHMQTSSEH
jgi:DNA-binding MarR family transcriptional regulator